MTTHEQPEKKKEVTFIESRIIRGTDFTVRAGVQEAPSHSDWYSCWIDLPMHNGWTTYMPGGVYMDRTRAIHAADAMAKGFLSVFDLQQDLLDKSDEDD